MRSQTSRRGLAGRGTGGSVLGRGLAGVCLASVAGALAWEASRGPIGIALWAGLVGTALASVLLFWQVGARTVSRGSFVAGSGAVLAGSVIVALSSAGRIEGMYIALELAAFSATLTLIDADSRFGRRWPSAVALASLALPLLRLLDGLYSSLLGVQAAAHLDLPISLSIVFFLFGASSAVVLFEREYTNSLERSRRLLRPGVAVAALMTIGIVAMQYLRIHDDPYALVAHYGSSIVLTAISVLVFLAVSWEVLLQLASLSDRESVAASNLAEALESNSRSLQSAKIGAWERDLRTGSIKVSSEAASVFGIEPTARTLTYEALIGAIHPEDKPRFLDAVNACIFGGADYELEYRIRTPGGVDKWISAKGDVCKDAEGTPVLFAGVVEDITERKLTEQRLLETQLRYERVADNIPGVVYQSVQFADGREEIAYISESVREVFGHSRDEVVRHPELLTRSIHPEEIAAYESSQARASEKAATSDWTGRILRLDGQVRWIHRVSQPTLRPDGATVWDGVVLDVTSHREAVQELNATRDRLAWILRSSPVVVYACAAEPPYPLTYLSDNAGALLGIPAQEWLTDPNYWHHRVHPDDVEAAKGSLEELGDGGTATLEYRIRIPSGEYRWIRDEMRMVTEDGQREVVGTVVDVTERRVAQDALRLSDERFRAMSGASPLGIFMADPQGKVVYVNAKMAEIVGRPGASLLEAAWLGHVHPDDAERVAERYSEAVSRTAPTSFQCRMRNPRRGTIWASIKTAPMRDGARVIGYVGTLEDVTEVHDLELQSEQARIEAEKASQAKSVFLSRISHELRAPLHSMLGFAQLLEMDDLNPKQRESVEYILKGGRHLASLITDVLDVARAESGELHVDVRATPLFQTARDAIQMLDPLARTAGVTVDHKLADEDGVYVQADPQRLRQVLLNILSNAIKYNRPEGIVTVSCQVLPDRTTVLSVRDTGTGIPPEKTGRLFVPFERLGAEQSGIEGTGLGLALSKRLLEAMGGSITIESDERIGTEARIELVSSPPLVRRSVVETPGGNRKALRILILSEEPAVRALLESVLGTRPSDSVSSADSSGSGIQSALRNRPDLVFLDESLSGATAVSALETMRREPVLAETAFVVVGTDMDNPRIERFKDAGAAACINGPIVASRLLALVDSLLGATRT